jgi:hypothetical protein
MPVIRHTRQDIESMREVLHASLNRRKAVVAHFLNTLGGSSQAVALIVAS